MKKRLGLILAVAAASAALMCASAWATDTITSAPSAGIYNVNAFSSSVTLEPMEATGDTAITAGTAATAAGNIPFYSDAARVRVTYTAAASGKEYVLMVLSSETSAPTKDDIVYVNQKTTGASETSVQFVAYPSALTAGKTYYVYLSSNDGTLTALTKVGSFDYYAPYTLGDVNEDTKINSSDAVLILQHAVKIVTLDGNHALAANVNKDSKINSSDAVLVLQYAVKIITSFD